MVGSLPYSISQVLVSKHLILKKEKPVSVLPVDAFFFTYSIKGSKVIHRLDLR